MLVCIADFGNATGVATRGVIPSRVGLSSWTSRTRMTGHALICTADRRNAIDLTNILVTNYMGFS
jgi:hypothetical protein